MSGPKVVRLVTREEVEAICRQEIAAFAAAAEALLLSAGGRWAGEPAAGEQAAAGGLGEELAKRRRRLEELFAAGRFLELQKVAPQQAAFLRLEAAGAEDKARAAAQGERARRRRLADAAASVARAFPQAAAEMRELGRRALTVPAAGLEAEQQALDRAWRALTPAPAEQPSTAAQRELAARLGAGEERATLEGWLESRSVARQPRDLRLDGALAELEALGGEAAARTFASRAAALLTEPEARQAPLADSLLLDLGAELRRRREEGALRQRLLEAQARLTAATVAAPLALAGRLEAALAAPSASTAEPLLAEVRQTLDRTLAELAAAARRRAVLAGLAALGYEVRENMATAWVEGGRIVVQKPGSPDYGVELGAPADASRFQVRLVGAETPAAPRSPERDRDQETIWCQDFERLRRLVAQDGGETTLERAQPAGEVPVKTVPLAAGGTAERSREIPSAQRRTLPPS